MLVSELLHTVQRAAAKLERSPPMRLFPNTAYELRRIVLLLGEAIDQTERQEEAVRAPSRREVEHRQRELAAAGVATPAAWWPHLQVHRNDAA